MTRPTKTVRRRQRGQSALLAVVAVIVLAIGMYTSYNLSRAVYEKIKLQNTADATAYSLATLEARTFNFIAFVNRAQVANYVQMMEAQSLLSNATYLEGALGMMGDTLVTTGNWLIFVSYAPGAGGLKPIGEALVEAGKAIDLLRVPVTEQINTSESLDITSNYILRQTLTNKALFAVSSVLAWTTLFQLADGGSTIVRANDPNAQLTKLSDALNVINMLSFGSAFDLSATNFFGSQEDRLSSKRLMAELANASRYGTGVSRYVVGREPADLMVKWVSDADFTAIQDGIKYEDTPSGAREVLGDAMGFLLGPHYVGTTKLMTMEDDGKLPDLGDTGEKESEQSAFAVGEAIVAKDQSDFPFRGAYAVGFASVRSSRAQSEHCRWKKPEGNDAKKWGATVLASPLRFGALAAMMAGNNDVAENWFGFHCYAEGEEGHHHLWKDWLPIGEGSGIGPYLRFASSLGGGSVEGTSFNQPDVWVFLNKLPEQMRLDKDEKDLDFEIEQGGLEAELRAGIGEDAWPYEGMNVFARAQVYYHRPGAWQEPPNFFNPYWGARLAPKGAAIGRILNVPDLDSGLGALVTQFVADNVWMH